MCINPHYLLPFSVPTTPIGYKKFSDFTLENKKTRALQGFSRYRALALLVLYLVGRGKRPMEYRRKLITGMIGLAMLATPIAAAAKDHDGRNESNQPQAQAHSNAPVSRSYNMPARPEARSDRAQEHFNAPARNVATAPVVRQERHEERAERNFRSAPVVAPAPAVTTRRDWREDRHENRIDNRWNRNDARRDYVRRDYDNNYRGPNYGNRDYYNHNDAWVMPRNYAGGSCAWARHLRVVYNQDRYSGHPAAAADLLPRLHRAERACSGSRYGYNRWHR